LLPPSEKVFGSAVPSQAPQGRAVVKERSIYTVISRLPIEADGRPRYRIKSKTEKLERVVTEEQLSRLTK
jgi:hypothetical protein